MPVALVVDGAFFLRRFRHAFPRFDDASPLQVAHGLLYMASSHLSTRLAAGPEGWSAEHNPVETSILYRIFFYDCPPLTKKVHTPVGKKSLDLSKTPTARFRTQLHETLQELRKVTLRLGRLNDDIVWRPKPAALKRWLSVAGAQPEDEDFELDVAQKGVDMRLGLDVASMAFKRQIDQIVLVAADADFVPAVKLARREGLDVVLETLGGQAAKDLRQHVDGVRNFKLETAYNDL